MSLGGRLVANWPVRIGVVLTSSMEPTINRGDVVFLSNYNVKQGIGIGEIISFNTPTLEVPVLHRVVQRFNNGNV